VQLSGLFNPGFPTLPTLSPFGGVRVVESHHALKESTERLFPESKHRSKRIRKKLIQRFGGEFRKVPCIFKTADGTIIAHPTIAAEIRRQIARQTHSANLTRGEVR
jgi:hypothetical protein